MVQLKGSRQKTEKEEAVILVVRRPLSLLVNIAWLVPKAIGMTLEQPTGELVPLEESANHDEAVEPKSLSTVSVLSVPAGVMAQPSFSIDSTSTGRYLYTVK